jgi:hypothetical protein
MAAHRKLDQRRGDLWADGLRKSVQESLMTSAAALSQSKRKSDSGVILSAGKAKSGASVMNSS